MTDISNLPPPPETADISDLPPPPGAPQSAVPSGRTAADVSSLPPPLPEELQQGDFERIASKYGVDPTDLRSVAPYYQVKTSPRNIPEALTEGAKATAGFVGSAVGLNVPQYIYKKFQSEPMRKAIDELQGIAREQATPLEMVRDFAVPGVGIPHALTEGRGILKSAARLGEAVGTGAIAGTAGSQEGEEAQSARRGATLGLGLGVAGESLGLLLARKNKPNRLEQELADQQGRAGELNLERGAEQVANRTQESEDVLRELTFSKKEALSKYEIDELLKQQLGESTVAKYLDSATEEGSLLRTQLGNRLEGGGTQDTIRRQLVDDIVETRVRDFAHDLTGVKPKTADQAMEQIAEVASRQGQEAIQNRYGQFVKLKQAEKYLAETGARVSDQPNFFGRALDFMSDNQFVFRNIDRRTGSNLEQTISDLNGAYNRSTYALRHFREKQADIFRDARKIGTDNAVVATDKLYRALDSGDAAGLSSAEKLTAEKFREYFDGMRDFANRAVAEKDPRIAPLNIPKLENYVPHLMRPSHESVPLIEKKLEQTLGQLSQQTGREIRNISQLSGPELATALKSSSDFRDLERVVRLLDNKPISSPQDMADRLGEILHSRHGNIALETVARSSLERTDAIPDFLLEKNLYKLADMYTANTIRHLYLRNGMDSMRLQAKALRKAGAEAEAHYTENLIRDIMGVRKGTAAEAFMQTRIATNKSLDSMIEKYGSDSIRGGILTSAKSIPDVFHALSRQIYPNLLGYFNVRAAIQNFTSAWTKIAPELGGTYGYSTTLRSAVYTVANLKKLVEKSKLLGHVPDEFIRKGEQAIAEGIRRSAVWTIPAHALEGMGKAGMILFTKLEDFNRALTIGVGEIMAHDLSKESSAALGALRNFPPEIRRLAIQNRQNPERVSEILGKYLNDVTQFNYNRISLSEFGRTMGPIFSTFSKWPTSTAGDIIQELRAKGLLRGMQRASEKYMIPLMLLQSIDYVLGERMGDRDSLSDRQKKLMGSAGLSQSAPIGSASGFLTGEIFTPPAVDAITQAFIVPVMEGNTAKLMKGVGSIVQNFTPGAGLFRFITDDLVTYASGSKPEGSNFLEKTAAGARTIEREINK